MKTVRLMISLTLALLASDAIAQGTKEEIPAGYTKCAESGYTCKVTAPGKIVFGARTSFTAPVAATKSITCTIKNFGDPLPRVVKACYFMADPVVPPTPPTGTAIMFNVPPPWCLHCVPPSWSMVSMTSSREPTTAPPQCVRPSGAPVHVAVLNGTANGQSMSYTICENDESIVGWWTVIKPVAKP